MLLVVLSHFAAAHTQHKQQYPSSYHWRASSRLLDSPGVFHCATRQSLTYRYCRIVCNQPWLSRALALRATPGVVEADPPMTWSLVPGCCRMQKSRRRGCGTSDSNKLWLNTEACGMLCAAFVWAIVLFCSYGLTVGSGICEESQSPALTKYSAGTSANLDSAAPFVRGSHLLCRRGSSIASSASAQPSGSTLRCGTPWRCWR